MRFKVVIICCLLLSFTSCRKAVKEGVKTTTKSIAKKAGKNSAKVIAVEGVHRASKKLEIKTAKEFISHFKLDAKYLNKIDVLNNKQWSDLANEMQRMSQLKQFITKHPQHIQAYKKMHGAGALRTDIGYLRNVMQQIEKNPAVKPTIHIRLNASKAAVDRTKFQVPIVNKVFKFQGVNVTGAFPDFSRYSAFSTKLRAEQYFLKDKEQFKLAKRELQRAYKTNPKAIEKKLYEVNGNSIYSHAVYGNVSGQNLVKLQLSDIQSPNKSRVMGLTWHHKESYGVMELVNTHVHDKIRHTGGRSIWGGGKNYR